MAEQGYALYDPYAAEKQFLKTVPSLKEWEANVIQLANQLANRPNPQNVYFVLRKNPLDLRSCDVTYREKGTELPKSGSYALLDAALNGAFKVATEEEIAAAKRHQKEHQLRKLKRQGDLAAAREVQLDLGRQHLTAEIQKREAELFADPQAKAAAPAADPK